MINNKNILLFALLLSGSYISSDDDQILYVKITSECEKKNKLPHEISFENCATTTPFTTNAPGFYNDIVFGCRRVYGPQEDGRYIDYLVPVELEPGDYMLEYSLGASGGRGMVDVSLKTNGNEDYTVLRNQVDMYTNISPVAGTPIDDSPVTFREYFTVNQKSSCNVRWTVNGKNPYSGGYYILLCDCVRLTKIG